jgi:hypothetical protein
MRIIHPKDESDTKKSTMKQLYTQKTDYLKRKPAAKTLFFLRLKIFTMKRNKKNIFGAHSKVQSMNHNGYNRMISSSEPVPLNLLERPNDARAKQWEDTDMPSDFWL